MTSHFRFFFFFFFFFFFLGLLFLSEGIDRLVLICSLLAFKTALSSPLKEPDHLFDLVFTLYIYLTDVFVWFGHTVEERTLFH
jgi:hypothetical protein